MNNGKSVDKFSGSGSDASDAFIVLTGEYLISAKDVQPTEEKMKVVANAPLSLQNVTFTEILWQVLDILGKF